MCGIVGVRRFDGQPVREELLRAMTARLTHRGPDGEGYWVDGSIGFGHRRLSIIDVAGSPQPMATADERVHVTFNGEIFNFRQLREGCDYPFRTNGDTEVLLALYRREGARSVERLRGQFAYAVHDGDDLWLFRDRLGVLPLFTYADADMFAFASELKALLPALPTGPSVDLASLDSYLSRRAVAAPHTLFENVKKLLPGHRQRVSAHRAFEPEPYWSVPTGAPRRVSDDEAVQLVSDGLEDAVRSALVADVPVGSLLSGGVDSSLIVALATKLREGEAVDTFSAGFGDPRYDELPHAREVSRVFGTNHHEVVVEPANFADLWSRLTWHRDAPLSEPADVAVFELATLARQSVKVLLSGEGSDELFAGYPKYKLARFTNLADAVPAPIRASVFGEVERRLPASAGRARIALRTLAAPTEVDRLASWFAPFTAPERRTLLAGVPERPAPEVALGGVDAIERMLEFDCQGWLADNLLERGDRMAMAASVELRPPFLDHRLVELAFSLPSRVKVHDRQTKWVLKQVARRHLPESIVDRRKVGFRVPLDAWFRDHLREMARDLLLGPSSFVGSTLDPTSVRALLDTHESGRRDESIRIWTLLSLEVWHDVYFRGGDGSAPPVAAKGPGGG
jgi:asparagine synthase (glutamine-hydrolysing)